MNDPVIQLHSFVENVEKMSVHITIDRKERFDDINHYVANSFSDNDREFFTGKAERTGAKAGIVFSEDQKKVLYLSYAKFGWHRSEQESGEGFLRGGCSFSGDMFSYGSKSSFWDTSLKLFLEYEPEVKTDIELIKKLRWFESLSPPIEQAGSAEFGCILPEYGTFPDQFYFYDSGLVYPLPFKSFDEYIQAMINSAAVTGWQYFFIEPQQVVEKNKSVNYLTWKLHSGTTLGEEYKSLVPVAGADKYDRLDMIYEYLKRCMTLLPGSFPFLHFQHHRDYFERLEHAYKTLKPII